MLRLRRNPQTKHNSAIMKPHLTLLLAFAMLATACRPGTPDSSRLTPDAMLDRYVADTALLAVDDSVMGELGGDAPYLCDRLQLLDTTSTAWQHPEIIGQMLQMYNILCLYDALSLDLDSYQRLETGADTLAACLRRLDVGFIATDTLRALAQHFIDSAAAVFALGDSVLDVDGVDDIIRTFDHPAFKPMLDAWDDFHEAIDLWVITPFERRYQKYATDSLPDREEVGPERWLPDVYTAFTSLYVASDSASVDSLCRQLTLATDPALRGSLLFALLAPRVNPDILLRDTLIIPEAERLMERGEYSPVLDLVWRAYRVAWNDAYTCPSTYCYSPNLRYNHFRRLVALALLRHIDSHPTDAFAWLKFRSLATRPSIMRFGDWFGGNQALGESFAIYYGQDIL